jgi:hypothetical protein
MRNLEMQLFLATTEAMPVVFHAHDVQNPDFVIKNQSELN